LTSTALATLTLTIGCATFHRPAANRVLEMALGIGVPMTKGLSFVWL
jgi:hypothetical protein